MNNSLKNSKNNGSGSGSGSGSSNNSNTMKNNLRASNITNKITGSLKNARESVSSSVNTVSDKLADIASTVSDKIENATGIEMPSAPSDDSMVWNIVKTIGMVLIFLGILWTAKYFYINYEAGLMNAPMLLDGTKNSKQGLVISQDPKNTNYIPITPSEGRNGIEFSYSFWLDIEDMTYKSGQWKHVFHKGNSSSYPNRGPGVWIHPNSNVLRIYMNTQDQIFEYVDIDNIPTRKWLHVVIVLRNKILDVYVNGYLKVRKELSSIPRQNTGDFWINMFGGFEGFLSNIQYFNQAISGTTVQTLLKKGPSASSCQNTGETPPYMDNKWWFST